MFERECSYQQYRASVCPAPPSPPPNPSNGLLQLELPAPCTLSLFDAQGRLVQQPTEVPSSKTAFRFDHLAPGLYRVKAETALGVFWGRWVKI